MKYNENVINLKDLITYDIIAIEVEETAVLYPWGKMQNKYFLQDDLFAIETRSNLIFHEIRANIDLENPGMKLKEKYKILAERYSIQDGLVEKVIKEELFQENFFARKREFIWKLYSYLKLYVKHIYFVYNRSLDIDILQQILHSLGYDTFDGILLKSEAEEKLKNYVDCGKRILSIGRFDYVNDKRCGFVFIPETAYVFSGGYNKDIIANHAQLRAAGNMIYIPDVINSPGYSIMNQIVANRFFDNPFVEWKTDTEFNAEPYLIGYYALGMHLVGIIKWIADTIKGKGFRTVLFCARDGFLIKKAYDCYRRFNQDLPESEYIQGSRKLLLPYLLKSKRDFYSIPGVIYYINSPHTIMFLLWEFAKCAPLYDYRHESYHIYENVLVEMIEKAGFKYEECFESQKLLDEFISFYLDTFYDLEKHKKLVANIEEYYRKYTNKDILFDLGYSGKLAKAIIESSSGIENVLYLYTDEYNSEMCQRIGKFTVNTFYNFKPAVDNSIREYLISENGPSCIGLKRESGKILPVFEVDNVEYCHSNVIKEIQNAALEFVQNVYDLFQDKWNLIPFKGQEVSMPFEGFIREISDSDLKIFIDTYQENYTTGKQSEKNWAEYYRDIMSIFPSPVLNTERE